MSRTLIAGISLDTRYSGAYLPSSFAAPLSRQPAYLTVDGTLSIKTRDERLTLAIIGKNLTNRFIVGGVVDGPNTGANTGNSIHNLAATPLPADQLGFVSMPRTVQLQVTVKF